MYSGREYKKYYIFKKKKNIKKKKYIYIYIYGSTYYI